MDYSIELHDIAQRNAAGVVKEISVEEIPGFVQAAFAEVMRVLQEQQTYPAGPPFCRYRMLNPGHFEVCAGFPVPQPITASAQVISTQLQGGKVAKTLHVGSYSEVGKAYDAVMAWLPQHGLHPEGDPWEVYLDGPEVKQPRTEIFVPCRSM